MIHFDKNICTNYHEASTREWLETNGLGGYACGTIAGSATRCYHGLLVTSAAPPMGRMNLISCVNEILSTGNKNHFMFTNKHESGIYPRGFQYLEEFRLDPFPVFRFRVDEYLIEKTIFMPYGKQMTIVSYSLHEGDTPLKLQLRPYFPVRGYHDIRRKNEHINDQIRLRESGRSFSIHLYQDTPTVHVAVTEGAFFHVPNWLESLHYAVETERGLDDLEDVFSPGYFDCPLERGRDCSIVLSLSDDWPADVEKLRQTEIRRRHDLGEMAPLEHPLVQQLAKAADQFIFKRADGKMSILAGFPWFTDWGRDTMISLPGLTLATQRYDLAKEIIRAYAQFVDKGMLPNMFPDENEQPIYNTVDATLWYFIAIYKYILATDDWNFVRQELWVLLQDIINFHYEGTRYNIKADKRDGLLNAGDETTQLTWMDVKYDDWVVTPRHGKAVEINALWYNVLRIMTIFSERFASDAHAKWYSALAVQVHDSFNHRFWRGDGRGLYDCLRPDVMDMKIRPNQIFAVSLPFSIVPPEREKIIVEVVQQELLTPFGLRSLAPHEQEYAPRYIGNRRERDGQYHQGTVWGWLLGAFITAYLKVHGEAGKTFVWQLLKPMQNHLHQAGLGQISEVFDGDEPHAPRGCFAQAWSVAELLRCLWEDLEKNLVT